MKIDKMIKEIKMNYEQNHCLVYLSLVQEAVNELAKIDGDKRLGYANYFMELLEVYFGEEFIINVRDEINKRLDGECW